MNKEKELIKKLEDLEFEHRNLDKLLITLQDKKTINLLQIQSLKKRKLILKDKIIDLKKLLEPDIIA
tara:strand:+ start:42 stop:242 length:201 start_codon:yes stop_codon:yes gene_type:complete